MTVAGQIGLNLRGIRRKACMSQDDLSRRSGLHHSYISLLERGRRVPGLDICIRILRSTGGDPRDLLEGIEWHGPRNWDEKGWFTIAGLEGPAEVRPPQPGRSD
ncbi:MAG: helix-turn-helix transcriptional regulator [Actinobacteria bacterium]|nr:helix-turn-helix transcriptional regulator [Actinomycetota bacterium]